MLFTGRVSRSLLTLCLVRQSVLRGNVFNYKRKRVTVPSRVSRLSMTITTTAAITMPSFFISLPNRAIVKAHNNVAIAAIILLEINAFCLYKGFTLTGDVLHPDWKSESRGINHPLPSHRELSKRLIICQYDGRWKPLGINLICVSAHWHK